MFRFSAQIVLHIILGNQNRRNRTRKRKFSKILLILSSALPHFRASYNGTFQQGTESCISPNLQ